jgi:outer membrane receptor for ferrienterochelin and colicin
MQLTVKELISQLEDVLVDAGNIGRSYKVEIRELDGTLLLVNGVEVDHERETVVIV